MNNLKNFLQVVAITIFFVSCEEKKVVNNSNPVPAIESMKVKEKDSLKDLVFASKKDLVCGMPISAGVADTAIYGGKIYGFCALECKEEFKKNPKSFLVSK